MTEDELRRQVAHDFPLLEKIAKGDVERMSKVSVWARPVDDSSAVTSRITKTDFSTQATED
jgi:hypothetical protein